MSDPTPTEAAPRASSPSAAADADDSNKITFTVKASSEAKYTVTVSPSTTVADLKAKLVAEHTSEIPAAPRLIYSGRVLKDPETLESYKVKSGNTVHMVKPAPSSTSTANANAQANVPRNIAAGSGNNPLAGLTGARYAGHAQLPSASIFGPDGGMGPPPTPEQIAETMSNPMVQSQLNEMLQNPQFLDMIIQSNPQLRAMGPEVRQYMQTPWFRQMMTDPATIQQMSQTAAQMRGGAPPAFPGGLGSGSLGAQQGQQGQQGQQTPGSTANPTGTSPPPNPFVMFPSPGGEGGDPSAFLRTMMGGAPPAAGAGTEGGANPPNDPMALLRQMMEASGREGGAAANPFAGMFGPLGGVGAPQMPADTRPPEERYADQLRQLNDMGFYDFDRNVEALRRSGGSVQGAVNQLLGG